MIVGDVQHYANEQGVIPQLPMVVQTVMRTDNLNNFFLNNFILLTGTHKYRKIIVNTYISSINESFSKQLKKCIHQILK